jgi:hypothetical protein
MPAKQPCLCGSEDCPACSPAHFVNGQYLNPDHYCDVCQRFTGQVCEECIWCGMQICTACEVEHMDTCGKGENHGLES